MRTNNVKVLIVTRRFPCILHIDESCCEGIFIFNPLYLYTYIHIYVHEIVSATNKFLFLLLVEDSFCFFTTKCVMDFSLSLHY